MIASVPAPIKSRVTQAAELVSFEDAIAANLSYSGFYCTRDLEQKTGLSKSQATSSRTSAGFLSGRNSPRVTASGTEKA